METGLRTNYANYAPFAKLSRTVHWDHFLEMEENKSMMPRPLGKAMHYLRGVLPALQVVWFGTPIQGHNWYGNVSFEVDMQTLLHEFRQFKKYFVEVIDYNTQNASRILLTSQTYDALREYDPSIRGGPWFVDEDNQHFWLTSARRCNSNETFYNGHALEFMLELSPSEAKKIFRMAAVTPADHAEANEEGYMKCKEYKSGPSRWRPCPYDYPSEVTHEKLMEHFSEESLGASEQN